MQKRRRIILKDDQENDPHPEKHFEEEWQT